MIKNLRAYRIAKNLQQKELAILINKPTSTVACYETQSNEPNIETLIKLADALGVSVDALIRDNSDIYIISKNEYEDLLKGAKIIQNLNRIKDTPYPDEGRRIKKKSKQNSQINIGILKDNHGIIGTNIGPVNSDKDSDSD